MNVLDLDLTPRLFKPSLVSQLVLKSRVGSKKSVACMEIYDLYDCY